ncbi:MAG: ABC transporter ATP-binding protein [Pseudomonadota bacterium]|nr:ABC transporter ATP-binding protein [Pseudomonadota bacterium]
MGVRLSGVSKSWGRPVLRAMDLHVEKGEIFALLGPSGCGKTTALRIVAGLETPDEGTVHVDGQLVAGPGTALPPEARQLGMVFQSYAVWPHMNVLENVAWPLRLRKVPDADVVARAALSRVRLDGFADRWPGTLSGGQQQRVAIARSLATRPRVLLLDEPLSNLDAGLREELRDQIAVLAREAGLTVLLVTHDQVEALSMCDRVAVMSDGVIQQVGAPRDIYLRPRTRFVAGFVGILNTLPALRRSGRVELAGLDAPGLESPGADGPVEIGFRPESARFAAQGMPCAIQRTVYRGAFSRHHALVGEHPVIVDTREAPGPCLAITDAWVLGD